MIRVLFTLFWKLLLRPVLFLFDAEKVHEWSMKWFTRMMSFSMVRNLVRRICRVSDESLKVELWGLSFSSPVGLAAGFDKNGEWFEHLQHLGFGFLEIGTLTPLPQSGNEQPRLFRLPKDKGIINRMGFNNLGANAAVESLQHRSANHKSLECVLAINIGKNKQTPNTEAVNDYLACLEKLFPFANTITVNVSSPNTIGLRDLQDPSSLRGLLQKLEERNQELAIEHSQSPKPILLKIAPDLTDDQLGEIARLALDMNLSGMIATNTTIERSGLQTDSEKVEQIGAGGLSGKPLTLRSREVIGQLYQLTEGKIPLVGVGGVLTANDAWEMFRAGASLIQVYTGFIYGGPLLIASLNRELVKRLAERKLDSISHLVGEAHSSIRA